VNDGCLFSLPHWVLAWLGFKDLPAMGNGLNPGPGYQRWKLLDVQAPKLHLEVHLLIRTKQMNRYFKNFLALQKFWAMKQLCLSYIQGGIIYYGKVDTWGNY